ncbi:MAG: extracellular solute-binding protein, partial [Lachnospiraceae bacterium]|nr:extracellular solute-binding protein [Lachnospiraceae bacterium]
WVVDKDNNPTVNTKEFKEALGYYINMISTGKALVKDEFISAVENGEALLGVGWPGWCRNSMETSVDYVEFPGKKAENSVKYNSNIYGIWTMGVTNNCTTKELAVELLNYLCEAEVQKSTMPHGGVPCRYSCLTDEKMLKENPKLSIICGALENGVYRPTMSEWPQFYTILGDRMRDIITGEVSIEDGLELAQRELENIMK